MIPRQGGDFIWQQAVQTRKASTVAVKIAMFDEVDESTAMYKLAPTRADAPDQAWWLTLDADGHELPSDWYLRVSSCLTAVMQGKREITDSIPIDPEDAWEDSSACWDMSLDVKNHLQAETGPEAVLLPSARGVLLTGLQGISVIEIHDLKGRLVETLEVDAGEMVWPAMVKSGTYMFHFYGITAAVKKVTFLY